jgi:hypothetical protein
MPMSIRWSRLVNFIRRSTFFIEKKEKHLLATAVALD